jgi:hypothetical protein
MVVEPTVVVKVEPPEVSMEIMADVVIAEGDPPAPAYIASQPNSNPCSRFEYLTSPVPVVVVGTVPVAETPVPGRKQGQSLSAYDTINLHLPPVAVPVAAIAVAAESELASSPYFTSSRPACLQEQKLLP